MLPCVRCPGDGSCSVRALSGRRRPRSDQTHPSCVTAEVQLHSSLCDRQEMAQLREQLIGAFQEQMDLRRQLMELENSYMEIQIESTRHLLTIAE